MVKLFQKYCFNGISIITFGFLSVVYSSSAQTLSPLEELTRYQEKYKDENCVSTLRKEKVDIFWEGDSLRVVSNHLENYYFITDKTHEFSQIHVPHSDFFQIKELKTKSEYLKGKRYKSSHTNTYFSVSDNLEGSIFHDDMVIYSISIPYANAGTKGTVSYKEIMKEPHFFGSFYFDTPYLITEKSVFEVVVPVGIKLAFNYFNVDSTTINYSVKEEKGKVFYRWERENTPATKLENGSEGYRHHAPHLVVRIASITKSGKEENYLNSVKDLHNWYYNFIRDVNKESSPELDSIAKAIVVNAKSDREKVKAIFYWVQDNIKYIAFEDGLGGFIPRHAKDICDKRYGDCKDMTSIMHQMLSIVGVSSNMTWIGTRDIPYSYDLAPTPAADNHMILSYKDNDEWVFVDGTSTFNEYGMPSSFIQGKEALIHIDSNNYVVIKVPTLTSASNTICDTAYLKISKNALTGNALTYYTGYYKQRANNLIEGKTDIEERKFFSSTLEKGSNKFLIDRIEVLNKRDRDQPLIAKYNFSINDYVYRNQDELFVNLHLDKNLSKDIIEKDRKLELTQRFALEQKWYYSLEIPEGYEVSFIPENNTYVNDKFSYEIKYIKTEIAVIVEFNYVNNFLVLVPEEFSTWNEMLNKLNSAFKKSITFKKKK